MPEQWTDTSLLWCNANHAVQCCSADAAMHTHYRAAALLWFHELVSPALFFLTVLSHSKRRLLYRRSSTDMSAPDWLLASVFSRNLTAASARGAWPWSRANRSVVPQFWQMLVPLNFLFSVWHLQWLLVHIFWLIVSWKWQTKWEKAIANWEALPFNTNLSASHTFLQVQFYKVSVSLKKMSKIAGSQFWCRLPS